MKTHVYHDCLAKKWLLASGGHLAWRHESNTPICKRICGLCSQLTHGGIEICHRRTRRFTIKSAHGPHCTHTPYIPQSRPVLTTEARERRESAPFGEPSVDVDSTSLASPILHLRALFSSLVLFTRRALPVPQPHRAGTLPAPTPRIALHTSPVIEQAVQVVLLSFMHRLHLIGQRLTHQAYDQAVALDGTHALLQLEQDLVLVLDIATLCLPIGEKGGSGP